MWILGLKGLMRNCQLESDVCQSLSIICSISNTYMAVNGNSFSALVVPRLLGNCPYALDFFFFFHVSFIYIYILS